MTQESIKNKTKKIGPSTQHRFPLTNYTVVSVDDAEGGPDILSDFNNQKFAYFPSLITCILVSDLS